MDSERRNRTGLAQPYESCRITRPTRRGDVRLWEESNLRPRASHARVLSGELQRRVMSGDGQSRTARAGGGWFTATWDRRIPSASPSLKALGRIRTSNHQVRSLALWSIELRGQVSCTCEWRMRASNPPVVPGANRVTTPSSPIPQAQRVPAEGVEPPRRISTGF